MGQNLLIQILYLNQLYGPKPPHPDIILTITFVTALAHLIYLPYIHLPHAQLNLDIKNQFSIVSPRRMENKGISILLMVDISLILSKAIQHLIINIDRTRSFKWQIVLSTTSLSFSDKCSNKRSLFRQVQIVLHYSVIYFSTLMRQTTFKGFPKTKDRNKP